MRNRTTLAALLVASCLATPVAAQDRYQWLENPTDPKALTWAKQETAKAQTAIAAMPNHAAIEAELKRLLAAGDPPPDFMLMGSVTLRFQRSVAHPHGVMAVGRRTGNGAPGDWRDVLDVDALRKAEGKAYELHFGGGSISCAAPTYSRCLIPLSPQGGDETELREFDLETGKFVADGFRTDANRTSATWFDKDRILIEHSLNGAPKLATGWPATVSLWTRGTPLTAAKVVYRAQPTDALMSIGVTGDGADRVGVIMRAIDYSNFEHLVVRGDGSVESTPIPRRVKMLLTNSGGGRIFAQLGEAATVGGRSLPAETVIAYDTRAGTPQTQRLGVVLSPTEGEFLTDTYFGIAPGRSGVKLVLTQRGVQRIATATQGKQGWTVVRDEAQPAGTAIAFSATDPGSDAVIVRRAGYLLPNRLELIDDSGKAQQLYAEAPAFDASGLVTELKTAISKDGTPIDYYLVRPKASAGGATPLLMTGYGAFGISFAPEYLGYTIGGKSVVPWLTRGGALALPLIRGGGERGEAWHQAAIREKRQNSYDDFAAVTQAIIKDGLTTPAHIGVFGSSNGGLLAAVMGTQRPDLYGAVVSDVPLTDLVRMPFMGMGAAWTNEYGDPKDPAMAAAINRYSPYQNVVAGKKYPPFMLTVATSDNRVGPGHARKLAAKLKDAGSQVYYLEDQEGGHGVSDPLSRPELMANRMTFLIDTLVPK
ncbi:prolyl oligopeptidase family serine peptidase [Sphingomonas sp. RB3P16]|uniref:prolyl oligopeptidase family serine peptidase n=1 Tax=Parasphingomonas frigoris TaxID=3096163 RepID=UPI002FCB5770